MPRSAEATGKLWRSLQDVTSKVTPQVQASLAKMGSSTKEVWLEPLREITRDIAGDVREAFRPGGAADAHAALRASAQETRGVAPRNAASHAPSTPTGGDTAMGASGGFRGGIGWEPTPPKPPSAAQKLDSIFASLDEDDRPNELDSAERGANKRYGEITEEDVDDGEYDANTSPSTSGRLLRDETKDTFSKLSSLRGESDSWYGPVEKIVRFATATPGFTVAFATVVAMLLVLFIARDHGIEQRRMVETQEAGGEGGENVKTTTLPPPLPP